MATLSVPSCVVEQHRLSLDSRQIAGLGSFGPATEVNSDGGLVHSSESVPVVLTVAAFITVIPL